MSQRWVSGMSQSGIQSQKKKQFYADGRIVKTVQEEIENGLSIHFGTPKLYTSSRTDAGVHAINTALHVDLECPSVVGVYDPDYINRALNKYFEEVEVEIRIREVLPVSQYFHSRYSASSRTYLYRLGVYKNSSILNPRLSGKTLPIVEWSRLHVVSSPFDIDKFQEGASCFLGLHDFRSFASKKIPKDSVTLRRVDELYITPGKPFMDPVWDSMYKDITILDIKVKGKGFLRTQVRRMVGSLISLAKGKASIEGIKAVLKSNEYAWNDSWVVAPAYGLYLADVEYPSEVLKRDYIRPCEIDVGLNAALDVVEDIKIQTETEEVK